MKIFLIFGLMGSLLNIIAGDSVDVRVVKCIEVQQKYYKILKGKPFEVKVEGPTTVRFYTRLVMPKGLKHGTYKLILEEDEAREKVIVKETEVSKSSRVDGQRVGKWRSFVVDVPAGVHTYKIHLFEADGDAVLIRPVIISESEWQEVAPKGGLTPLTLVDGDQETRFWLIEVGKPVEFEFDGNVHAKLIIRLNFEVNMPEPQSFSVVISENDRIVRDKTFRARKSKTSYYKEKGDVIPSVQKALNFSLGKGHHVVKVEILSGVAKSAAIRLIVSKPKVEG
ncbi:MAG: hypothetical protein DRQ10_01385 [Candidatus Hydrothermota bacterium]|nr:MAG: hypothetical protein DRQ10_01385 [Candidatus Hydrothermae bacterium]